MKYPSDAPDEENLDALRAASLRAFIFGKHLGSGIARDVYVYRPDPKLVIKVQKLQGSHFQNTAEWENWSDAPANLRKFLAPCRVISPCGRYLLQDYTEDLPDRIKRVRLPSKLTDFQRKNYGLLNGRVVARDYGILTDASINATRMVRFYRGDST